jgi:hypothetical protein
MRKIRINARIIKCGLRLMFTQRLRAWISVTRTPPDAPARKRRANFRAMRKVVFVNDSTKYGDLWRHDAYNARKKGIFAAKAND